MTIIEYDSDLRLLNDHAIRLIVPVWSSPKGHECGFPVSFVYIRTETDEFIINFRHIDAKGIVPFDVGKLAGTNAFVLGHRYLDSRGIDYEWAYFETFGKPFDWNEFTQPLYRTYRVDLPELNDCIPLMKWIELIRTMTIPMGIKPQFRKYSDAIQRLGRIEGAGVAVDVEKVVSEWEISDSYIHSGLLYTKYNPYTVTGRPTNRHLGINWSALNKSDGSRSVIRSRFGAGSLIQFDFESYHIRLIARLIGYEFPDDKTAHEHLAEWYGPVDRETAKGITFRYLYGGLDELGRGIPFFQRADEFIKKTYRQYVLDGRLTTPIMGREIGFERIGADAGEQKVFNYFLQALETEVNYHKIGELLEWFEGRRSKLILYSYDAFVIDAVSDERDDILREIPSILSKGGFPVKIYEGMDYDKMEVLL